MENKKNSSLKGNILIKDDNILTFHWKQCILKHVCWKLK